MAQPSKSMTKIAYDDIELAFDFVSSQPPCTNSAFISKTTGQIYFVSAFGDSDELPEDIEDAAQYIAIPHKNDLDLGIALVRAFVWQRIPEQTQKVEHIFSRKGAYARFKNYLDTLGLLEAWYGFEAAQTESALKRWCEENSIDIEE